MINLIRKKNFDFLGLFSAKIVNFGIDPYISDAETDTFIPFGADLFCIFETHRCSNNSKNNW